MEGARDIVRVLLFWSFRTPSEWSRPVSAQRSLEICRA